VGLAIDLPGGLEFALTGSLTGLSVTAGPVTITGDAAFTLVRQTVDVDTDGNGAADLIGATLDALALNLTSGAASIAGVATLSSVTGKLALASVTPAGAASARYTALKMGAVSVTGSLIGGPDFGVSATLDIDALDYNAAVTGFKRLDWARAFDLDGDGQFDDVVNPGAELALVGLAIDLPGGLSLR
jgi:hypothetical protein